MNYSQYLLSEGSINSVLTNYKEFIANALLPKSQANTDLTKQLLGLKIMLANETITASENQLVQPPKSQDALNEIAVLKKQVRVLQETVKSMLSYFGGHKGLSEVCLNHLELCFTVEKNRNQLSSNIQTQMQQHKDLKEEVIQMRSQRNENNAKYMAFKREQEDFKNKMEHLAIKINNGDIPCLVNTRANVEEQILKHSNFVNMELAHTIAESAQIGSKLNQHFQNFANTITKQIKALELENQRNTIAYNKKSEESLLLQDEMIQIFRQLSKLQDGPSAPINATQPDIK
ncbi:hypothetical protein FGO68_gene11870 [Halteria grandinella]|uniref:Uncharacterized protein n=1 Tax=Halteria grandinella TaxID=5974 RepID=A0A8J8T2A0_HALGN|nr:hypothetical protein FGO68_gene11870 [Halteria grandinella]